jgi:endonuclease YncB( thermonuclease family)
MLGRLTTGLLAIATFGRRAEPLTGPAKVLDGDTIIVAEQLIRLDGIDAPALDQTFWWRPAVGVWHDVRWPPSRRS